MFDAKLCSTARLSGATKWCGRLLRHRLPRPQTGLLTKSLSFCYISYLYFFYFPLSNWLSVCFSYTAFFHPQTCHKIQLWNRHCHLIRSFPGTLTDVTSNCLHNRIAERGDFFFWGGGGGWNVLNIKSHTPHYFNKRFVGHNVRILVAFLSWCQIKKKTSKLKSSSITS